MKLKYISDGRRVTAVCQSGSNHPHCAFLWSVFHKLLREGTLAGFDRHVYADFPRDYRTPGLLLRRRTPLPLKPGRTASPEIFKFQSVDLWICYHICKEITLIEVA